MHRFGERLSRNKWQSLAAFGCIGLAVLMILNTQMGGEAMWFWYSMVFLHGAKLYTELHTALQPLYLLEMAAWMRIFGTRLIVYEIPSLLHSLVLCLGIYLVLRESDWPDWQKAVVLLGTFVFAVGGHSYRFDDYHVLADTLVLYALLLLLIIGRPGDARQARHELGMTAALGIICGLTIVTRLTDGAALLVASALSLLFLVKRRPLTSLALFAATAALTLVLVVKITGDVLPAYVSSSIFRAAGSKGGTGSIFAAPFLVVGKTLSLLRSQKQVVGGLTLIVLLGAYIARYAKQYVRYIIPLQLTLATLLFLVASKGKKINIEKGLLFETVVLILTLLMYVMAVVVFLRFVRHKQGLGPWDPRQVLVLITIFVWASYSASSSAEPLPNFYLPVALLLLLVPVVDPFRTWAAWANPSVVSILALVALCGICAKVLIPYSWQNYRDKSMFHNRQWFHHPVYGEMYIDRDLLNFSKRVCDDIKPAPGNAQGALLSLPFPYPNYFCNTPPWHNYVQTFFDTATRGTIEQMMKELGSNPPEWIVYQRQLNIMKGAERLYNHGRPIAQRDLDTMIMRKLNSGEWTLVDHSDYLRPENQVEAQGTGWYVIRTHR